MIFPIAMEQGIAFPVPSQPVLVEQDEPEMPMHPADPIAWLHQGRALAHRQRHGRAIRAYNRAIQLMPNFSLALALRCASLNQLRRYQAAIMDCERALQGNGVWEDMSPAYAWSQRSHALIGLELYREAIASAERAIQLDPTSAEAWNNQAVALWRLNNYEPAAAAIAQSIALQPDNTQAQFNQGRILSSMQQYDAAIRSYCQALRSTAPYCTRAVMAPEQESPDQTNPDQPDPHLGEIASEIVPDIAPDVASNSNAPDTNLINSALQADVLVNLGVALWHTQQWESALAATQAAVSVNPQSFVAWYNQGIILIVLGRTTEALAAYEQADRLTPNSICQFAHPLSSQPSGLNSVLAPKACLPSRELDEMSN
jgi:tetratricopeptide (TPR) repeat protein